MRLQLRMNSGVSIMSKPSLTGREQQQSSPSGLGYKQAKKAKKYGANAPQLRHIQKITVQTRLHHIFPA
jgi:hypothetical protein